MIIISAKGKMTGSLGEDLLSDDVINNRNRI